MYPLIERINQRIEKLATEGYSKNSKYLEEFLEPETLIKVLRYAENCIKFPQKYGLKSACIKGRGISLPLGYALSIPRFVSNLPFKITILNKLNGEQILLVEPKSKNKSRKKKNKRINANIGAIKNGKVAYRIDVDAGEKWMASTAINDDMNGDHDDVICAHQEACLSHYFSDNLTRYVVGEPYLSKKKGYPKITVYSPLGYHDLDVMLNMSSVTNDFSITVELAFKYAKQLLEQLKEIHDLNYVHQDIKPKNIFVYEDSVKIGDFGLARQHMQYYEESLSTLTYASPEIILFHTIFQDKKLEYFTDKKHYSFGREAATKSYKEIYQYIEKKGLFKNINEHACGVYGTPHKANDMYSIGLVIAYMFLGKYPKYCKEDLDFVKENALLSGLLTPERSKRLNVDQALAVLAKMNEELLIDKKEASTQTDPPQFLVTPQFRLQKNRGCIKNKRGNTTLALRKPKKDSYEYLESQRPRKRLKINSEA